MSSSFRLGVFQAGYGYYFCASASDHITPKLLKQTLSFNANETGVAWEGLALEDKEPGGGRVGSESKAGFSSRLPLIMGGACMRHAGGELTHRREKGKALGSEGRRRHISIHTLEKRTESFQPTSPISGHG